MLTRFHGIPFFVAAIVAGPLAGALIASSGTIRVGTAQPKDRTIDFRLKPAEALSEVEKSLDELTRLVHKAGEQGCDVVAFPEDTLGLLKWESANRESLREVLPAAVGRMIERLGAAAAERRMYLVCCNDTLDQDGALRNTAYFLGRDGKEIGRYHKVQPTIAEARKPGVTFPVFPTADLGNVGMLICYDMVFPEAARCLALGGADIVFHPTLGGAAIGDDELSRAAFRTRAVENFVYLVVSWRGGGSMIISPQGKILAEAEGPDTIAIADIDPFGGREGSDAFNHQTDMRTRLFRERNPAAYGILTEPNPPGVGRLPATITRERAAQIFEKALTIGEDEFNAAAALASAGKVEAAVAAFERLRGAYPGTWIDRESVERLRSLEAKTPTTAPSPRVGIAARYAGDEGIEGDPRVLFADDFETGDLKATVARWGNGHEDGRVALSDDVRANSPGNRSVRIRFGHLYTHFKPADRVYVRYYMKFHPEFGYPHHLPFLIADRVPTPWPKGFADKKPPGDYFFGSAFDTYSDWGKLPPPGKWMLYTYWQDMKPDGRGDYWGNNHVPPQESLIERGRWYCLEMMIKANSRPDLADGEQAFWVDGKLVGEFKGFRWRSTDQLKLNSFWLLHDGETGSSISNDPDHAKRQYDVWFDDVVVATDYIGPVEGKPRNGKKVGVPSRSALQTPGLGFAEPGRLLFRDDFEGSSSLFKGGKVVTGGVNDSKALEVSPAGDAIWKAFSTPVKDSTTIRFSVKPLAEVSDVQVLAWSPALNDNARFHLHGLKQGEWTVIEFRALDLRAGFQHGEGAGLDGTALDNFKIVFTGGPAARMLLDEFEVRE